MPFLPPNQQRQSTEGQSYQTHYILPRLEIFGQTQPPACCYSDRSARNRCSRQTNFGSRSSATRRLLPACGPYYRIEELSKTVIRISLSVCCACLRASGSRTRKQRRQRTATYRPRRVLQQLHDIARLPATLADSWRPSRDNASNNSSFSFILNTDESRLIVPSPPSNNSSVFTCTGALGTPSRTGPLARKYLPGFPYS